MSGRYVELDRPWHETNVTHCQVCGRLIPRRAWLFDGGDGDLQACSPECETLYEGYVRPTYGVRSAHADH